MPDLEVTPAQLLMVGNSFRSDIAPALQIGAYAVHVPFRTIWAHERRRNMSMSGCGVWIV